MDIFKNEKEFEDVLIEELTRLDNQWEKSVLEYKTEKDLIENWKKILFENNRDIDRLNDYELTDTEMQQILEQIEKLKTPLKLNAFINGKTVSIIRDNPNDKQHFGKEISLKIYDKYEIAGGKSRYQIARQPVFTAKKDLLSDRRGDIMLLINGMPVIHIELKKNGIPVSKAYNQIAKYSYEHVFTGLFSLIQVFVAMTPEETVYFANPGEDGKFNEKYYFHWADFNNIQINEWRKVAETLLSIPMAHQLIGFYTVADDTDGVLKVLRSYQYFAINKIVDKVRSYKWDKSDQRGGYIWHTTGSGKTMTSFKTAQLISNEDSADKVVFLIDRIELGIQSAQDYKGFAEATDYVNETTSTSDLVNKLKDSYDTTKLIITSIQKMSNINNDEEYRLKKDDIDIIINKRIVFIVDECHRDTFGDMMNTIKDMFKNALFFGFTGTPIQDENKIKDNTAIDVFGSELHRYSIADGIKDKNVLGFDAEPVSTFDETDARMNIGLHEAKAKTYKEAIEDPNKKKILIKFTEKVPMAGFYDKDGKYNKGIEDYLLLSGEYRTEIHRKMVVNHIKNNFMIYSLNYKFHAIFATSSIPEAIEYYNLLKKEMPEIKITALFDPSLDNDGGKTIEKEKALVQIIKDYNEMYRMSFDVKSWAKMKKDVQNRLAHKKPYQRIHLDEEKDRQLNLLIVVDQMLTGYDSHFVNTLYFDKIVEYQNIIQAFSRTNRLLDQDKTHGIIRYYRAPYTMKKKVEDAVALYSGNKPLGIFVIKLDKNIENINAKYIEIKNLFEGLKISDFSKLPDEKVDIKKFIELFNSLNDYIVAAKVQGFTWKLQKYFINNKEYDVLINETIYNILLLRYKETYSGLGGGGKEDNPYDIKGYLTTIDTDEINAEYMDSKFVKYEKELQNGNEEEIKKAKEELLKTFASLNQIEQKLANVFLHDLETGDIEVKQNKTLREYINEYIKESQNDQIHKISEILGVNEEDLQKFKNASVNENNINEYGRFDNLCQTIDIVKAIKYFSKIEDKELSKKEAKQKADNMLREFILKNIV